MKLTKLACLVLIFGLFSISVFCQPAYALAATPAEQDVIRIHNSMPRRAQDSLFSYTAEWRIDDGELYRATGISFLNAAKMDAAAPVFLLTKKIVTSMKDGMTQLDPNWRGIVVSQAQDQPEFSIVNKKGYSLTTVTVRDYSNQPLRFDLLNKKFNDDGVQIGIDLVLTADVEYVDGYTTKKAQYASQGEIKVTIDDKTPIEIKTDGKTTKQIEEELSRQLAGSQLSLKPLYEGMVTKDTRNNKPFDGSEVQLLNLAAKSISIDITDPALGVLVKFKFQDENHSVKVAEPRFMMGVLGIGSLLAVGFIWFRGRKKQR